VNNKLPWRKQYRLDSDFFKTIDTVDKAYWFGFILADGCIVESRSPALVINVQIADKEHLNQFLLALGSTHSVRLRLNKSRNTISARLAIHNNSLVDDLKKLGCIPLKSTIGTVVLGIQQPLFRHFARGYFDGNGTIGFYRRHSRLHKDGRPVIEPSWACAGSLSILQFFRSNIQIDLPWFPEKIQSLPGCCRISISGLRKIQSLYDYLYSEAGPFLPRKKTKWEEGVLLTSAG
jgi:hypothetical protein